MACFQIHSLYSISGRLCLLALNDREVLSYVGTLTANNGFISKLFPKQDCFKVDMLEQMCTFEC